MYPTCPTVKSYTAVRANNALNSETIRYTLAGYIGAVYRLFGLSLHGDLSIPTIKDIEFAGIDVLLICPAKKEVALQEAKPIVD